MDLFLIQKWTDPRLAFNVAGIINFTLYGSDALERVWAPDTTFSNAKSVEFHKADGLWDNDVFTINSVGLVERRTR